MARLGKKLAVTVGDPSGVGPEIIQKWAHDNPQLCPYVEVIAHADLLSRLPSAVSKREVGGKSFKATPGKPCKEGAEIAFESLKAAAKGCLDGIYRAVTTAPISKFEMKKVGFDFPGKPSSLPTDGTAFRLWLLRDKNSCFRSLLGTCR